MGSGREEMVSFINWLLSNGYFCENMLKIDDVDTDLCKINKIFEKIINELELTIPSFEEALSAYIISQIKHIASKQGIADTQVGAMWSVLERYGYVVEGNMIHVFGLDDIFNKWLERLYFQTPEFDDLSYNQDLYILALEWHNTHNEEELYKMISEFDRNRC